MFAVMTPTIIATSLAGKFAALVLTDGPTTFVLLDTELTDAQREAALRLAANFVRSGRDGCVRPYEIQSRSA